MTEQHRSDCDWVDGHLEAYADGELPRAEANRVAAHLDDCTACRRALALAGRIRASLRDMETPACPGRVVSALNRAPIAHRRRWLPAAAGALAASLLAVTVMWPGDPDPAQPTPRELAEARQDLELALGYIAMAGQKASRDVGEVMTGSGVMTPIRDGMNLQLNIPVPMAARTEQAES